MMRAYLIGIFVCLTGSLQVATAQSPEVVEAAAPGYPRLPSGGRESGEVRVEVSIDAAGTVRTAIANANSGPDRLKSSAEAAARKWRFSTSERQARKAELAFIFTPRLGIGDPPSVVAVFTPPYRVEVFAEGREVVTIGDPAMVDVEKERRKKQKR